MFFRFMFGLAKPFLGKNANKIALLGNNSDLLKHFSRENLLIEHGGSSDFDIFEK